MSIVLKDTKTYNAEAEGEIVSACCVGDFVGHHVTCLRGLT